MKLRVSAVNSLEVIPAVGNTMYSLDKPPHVLVMVSETVLEIEGEVDVGMAVDVVDSWVFLCFDVATEQECSSSQSSSLLLPSSSPVLTGTGAPSDLTTKGGSPGKSNSDPHNDPHPGRTGSSPPPPSPPMTMP